MNSVISRYGKRLFAVCCVVLMVLLQFAFVMPSDAEANGGEDFEVRVQYEGERSGKIRTVTVFSNSDLEAMGAHNQMFSNVTRVGTLMRSAALGIELEKVIEAAGIDLDSVESFTFRASDGYTMTFYGEDYLGSSGWYYPNLGRLSHRVDSEDGGDGALQMRAGALDEGETEPGAILALKSFSTKSPSASVTYDKMTTTNSYRFFTAQTDLSYLRYKDENGNEAFYPTREADITAWDSVKYIYGVDVVLKGTPPLDGIGLDVIGDNMKVGSQVQIKVTFEGDTMEFFSSNDVTWSSSDESIATVDKSGIVTIQKEGEVTITAEAAGRTASVTINGEGTGTDGEDATVDEDGANENENQNSTDQTEKDKDNPDKVKAAEEPTKPTDETATTATKPRVYKKPDQEEEQKSDEDNKKRIFMAREISIGNEIRPEPDEIEASVSVKTDAQALEEAEAYDKKIVTGSAAAAILACGGGAVFRIRRFRIDLGKSINNVSSK